MFTLADKKYTILIVEDNEINREVLASILENDFNLLMAEDGSVAMRILEEYSTRIDLMLLDLVMPVMDGYEVLQTVKKDEKLKEIPVIVTTANESVDEEMRCLQMGAADFVLKPYNPIVVRLRVDGIFRLRESTQSNMQKSRFIQQISHEVRTPLNAILGFAEMMNDASGMSDEERRECLSIVKDNVLMLKRIIDDLLSLSEMDNGKIRIENRYIYINDICRHAVQSIHFCQPAGVEVTYTSNVADTFLMLTDGKRIQQLLVILLTNACKFTTQGEIRVHCDLQENGKKLRLSVTDTGTGIPADKAEYIFERFAKLDAFKQGSGLGLCISRSITRNMGGTIYLDTTYSQGARFIIELPIEEESSSNIFIS